MVGQAVDANVQVYGYVEVGLCAANGTYGVHNGNAVAADDATLVPAHSGHIRRDAVAGPDLKLCPAGDFGGFINIWSLDG